jgi:hypothetical protein
MYGPGFVTHAVYGLGHCVVPPARPVVPQFHLHQSQHHQHDLSPGAPTMSHATTTHTAPSAANASTSHAALASAQASAPAVRHRIIATLMERGGHTCDELEHLLGYSHQTTSARITDLAKHHRIRDSGTRRLTRSGHKAIVWEVVR